MEKQLTETYQFVRKDPKVKEFVEEVNDETVDCFALMRTDQSPLLESEPWAQLNKIWYRIYMRRWSNKWIPQKFSVYQIQDSTTGRTKLNQIVNCTPSEKNRELFISPMSRNWEYLVGQRLALQYNWIHGKYVKTSLYGHSDSVYYVQFDSNTLISGSRDTSIRFWDLDRMKKTKSLRGHKGSVLCVRYNSVYMVSGSSDMTMIVWDFKSGRSLYTINETAPVLDLRIIGKKIVSCSKTNVLKVWNIETGKLIRTLEGHTGTINCISSCGNMVATASKDSLIKLWNIETGEHVRDLEGHKKGVAAVQYDGDYVVSGGPDRTVRIWDAHAGSLKRTIKGHDDLVRSVCFNRERIVSGSYDMTVRVWNFETGEQMFCFRDAHTAWVYYVQMNNTKIISCGQDSKIVIWDFYTEDAGDLRDLDEVAREERGTQPECGFPDVSELSLADKTSATAGVHSEGDESGPKERPDTAAIKQGSINSIEPEGSLANTHSLTADTPEPRYSTDSLHAHRPTRQATRGTTTNRLVEDYDCSLGSVSSVIASKAVENLMSMQTHSSHFALGGLLRRQSTDADRGTVDMGSTESAYKPSILSSSLECLERSRRESNPEYRKSNLGGATPASKLGMSMTPDRI
ncbi:WD40-repeat-containing domain protein [Polychytrium aggregatum]|uniref:WD40-repeat-containing domain protein n=1 Tax=Polychytrium aggregatum TaxID=110093 RepID=UPI0022FEE8E1|nr:WD40-repeat-containing domain protein [Polychytrium aggregatum]KAI9199566.1 WD40-repeat-containing domain protein [Polychytrium aggregatum]